MGPVLAKASVSSLVFDYILTGPISVVSAGQYIGALVNEIMDLLHQTYHTPVNAFAAGFAVPVSYTHLDVYKRQSYTLVHGRRPRFP